MTLYNILFAVHILAIVAAFGPALIYPVIAKEARTQSSGEGAALAGLTPTLIRKFSIPALLVAAIAGMGLIGSSEGVWEFSQTWVSLSFAIVILLLADAYFFLRPAAKEHARLSRESNGSAAANAAAGKVSMATGLFHLGFVVIIILMIWKPGA